MWRWDQGRLDYFQFDMLREIAKVLVQFDNVDISQCESMFRKKLVNSTGLPFKKPENYTIKRNYSRVFQCSLLASFIGNKLLVTDICRDLALDNGAQKTPDDYLFIFASKFCFPFPAFEGYNSTEQRVYPFCAILKYLFSRTMIGVEAKASLDDIFHYIIANHCTGCEDIEFYKTLTKKSYDYSGAERRQLREMVAFFSQLSILKMYNGFIYLDTIDENTKQEILSQLLIPECRLPKDSRTEEFFEMTSFSGINTIPTFEVFATDPSDLEFIEGNRKRVEHFRVERSGLLRQYYRQVNPIPCCCACTIDMSRRYPWTDYMLEIHHLLPLSSAITITTTGTSLSDIVGLCPSCHRAVHMYYRKWLKANNQVDFLSKSEAKAVFLQAKKEITK